MIKKFLITSHTYNVLLFITVYVKSHETKLSMQI
jgi:hypothetical protein